MLSLPVSFCDRLRVWAMNLAAVNENVLLFMLKGGDESAPLGDGGQLGEVALPAEAALPDRDRYIVFSFSESWLLLGICKLEPFRISAARTGDI